MSNEQAKQILQQGIAAARAGQQAEARQLLQEAVKRDPQSEPAWLWLSSVARDDKERIFCLKQLLAINPRNENAIKGLRQLGIAVDGQPTPSQGQMAKPAEAGTTSPPSQTSKPPSGIGATAGVPVVDDQRLTATMNQLDPILQRYQPIPIADLPFQWAQKKRGRVGDASAMILRGAVAGVVLVVVLLLVGGGLTLLSRGGNNPVAAIFASATPSPTPTATLTPTPGFTDTPSPTPKATLEPSATPDARISRGDINNREATPIYPPVASGKIVRDSLALASEGKYDEAIAKLEGELSGLANAKNDDYYTIVYYMAQLYVDSGNAQRAVTFLNENKTDRPSFHAAMGYALYAQNELDNAFTEADTALKADHNMALAALTASRILTQRGSFTDARRYLSLTLEGQPGNALLLVERGKTSFAEEKYDDAVDDALLALYVDPLNRDAYILRIQALLAAAAKVPEREARIQAYGTAVLAVKDFLLYYPSETVSWNLLGQARQGEGNINEALNAYSQAIVSDKKSPDAQQVFIARGKLFLEQRQYEKAFDDFDQAVLISETSDALRGRYEAAVQLQNYKVALADANALFKLTPDDPKFQLTYANLLIQNQQYVDALPILTDKLIADLDAEDRPTAMLYRGIARFVTAEKPEQAPGLDDLNLALQFREFGLAHYYRGQMYELLNRPKDAIADYQWLVYWNSLYRYTFMEDVTGRLDKLGSSLPTPTPSNTPRPSATPSPTKVPSRTPRGTLAATATPTDTETPIETEAPTEAATESPTETPTATETAVS